METYPRKRVKKPPALVEGAVLLSRRGPLVRLVRPPMGTLLGGLWGPPFAMGEGALETLLPPARSAQRIGALRHVFSHRDLRATVYQLDGDDREGRWVPLDAPGPGISSLAKKALRCGRAPELPLLAADEPR